MRLNGTARTALVVLLLAVVLIPFGVPRFLDSGDDAPAGAGDDADFAQLCREHGGTPKIRSGTGAIGGSQRFCRVRYGPRVYLMDAITLRGFDADTANFQRQGCVDARRRSQAAAGSGEPRETFVHHPRRASARSGPESIVLVAALTG